RRRADVRQVKHTQIKQASCFLINRPKQALHSVSGIASDESAGAISEASMEQTSVAGAAASADDAALRPSVVTREAVATATAPHQPRPLGRNRDFLLLWTGQAVSVFGTRVAAIAYPLLVLSLTHSPAKVGLVSFANWIPAVLFGLPAGALVDRWDRRRVMIWCDLGRAAALASIVVALDAGVLTYPQVLAVAFCDRALGLLFGPAEVSALRHVVAPTQLARAIARNESREYSALLVGTPAGGAL